MSRNDKGFTLIELLIVMAIFVVIIMIASDSFKTILLQTTKLTRSEISNIDGVVGMEILRHDLEQAGFGLPTSFMSSPPTYGEVAAAPGSSLNDAPNGIPIALKAVNNRASVSVGTVGSIVAGTDYLAIKGSTVGLSRASQRWTYLTYSTAKKAPKRWLSENLAQNDRVVMMRRTFTESGYKNQLVYDGTAFFKSFDTTGFTAPFAPTIPQEIFYVYGIDTVDLRMPFNRSDYFVARAPTSSAFPTSCAPGTGVLYKGVVNHSDGSLTTMPLLDCVADMQVVFGWDLVGDGHISTYTNADATVISGPGSASDVESVEDIRSKLKLIKVYILAQDGQIDRNYTNTRSSIIVGSTGEASLTKSFDLTTLGANWMNYRWKVYRVIVRPKNFSSTN